MDMQRVAKKGRTWIRLLANFAYDWRRYVNHSFALKSRTRENRRAMLHILTHSLENGMSLTNPRPGFGGEKAASLLNRVEAYIEDYGRDASSDMTLEALTAYVRFHQERGLDLDSMTKRLERLTDSREYAPQVCGGTSTLTRAEVEAAIDFDYTRFMAARHSVRQYDARPVSREMIERAVRNAQRAPSVCNRQTCRVYAMTDKKKMGEALNYQNGNAGFRDEIGAVFVVTSNMQHLNLIGERYQGWVDGGIFAMSLLTALHAEGLGTCCLNWSVEKERDRAMRAHLGIPDEELVITMMCAGHLKDSFKVPQSQRKPLETVLTFIGPSGTP